MACGIGACLGCAVAMTDSEGRSGYRRVCHDGPVFDIREISRNSSADEQDNGYGIG
jgi:dihydroorotate dehydrogenase electron transfer subunit